MAKFDPAVYLVLRNEGGYCDDPGDPGGATKYGIDQRSHPGIDIKNLTVDQAKALYLSDWNEWGYAALNDQRLADEAFDLTVNTGPTTGRLIFQQAICGCGQAITIDGVIGPQSAAAANECDPEKLIAKLTEVAIKHYQSLVVRAPKLAKFLKGWVARVTRDSKDNPN